MIQSSRPAEKEIVLDNIKKQLDPGSISYNFFKAV